MRCQRVARAEGASLGHGGGGLLGKLRVIREEETWCCRRRNAVSKRARMDGDDDDDDGRAFRLPWCSSNAVFFMHSAETCL